MNLNKSSCIDQQNRVALTTSKLKHKSDADRV